MELFANRALGVDDLAPQSQVIDGQLNAVMVLRRCRHASARPRIGPGATRGDLGHPVMNLDIKRNHVAAQIGGHVVPDQHLPKRLTELGQHAPLRSVVAVDWMNRGVPQDELESGIRVFGENPVDPAMVDASAHHGEGAAHVHRVDTDSDDQQIVSPIKPCQTLLAFRTVLRNLVKHLSPDGLADRRHRVVVAGNPEHGNIQVGQWLHLFRKLFDPLLAEGLAVVIGAMFPCQSPDQVTEKAGELGARIKTVYDLVHCGKVFFVPTSRLGRTDTAIAVRDKVTPRLAARQQRLQRRGSAHTRTSLTSSWPWTGGRAADILPVRPAVGQGNARFNVRPGMANPLRTRQRRPYL